VLRTVIFPCKLPKDQADALNLESGRIYTHTLVTHYRVYRRTGHWLSPKAAERLGDALTGRTTLHAHSRDAAQQGFYKACTTARACRQAGLEVKYPYRRKRYRTTVWKNTAIGVKDGRTILAGARRLEPIVVPLPPNLAPLPPEAFKEVRLVWDKAGYHYQWHVVIEDGQRPSPAPGQGVAAVDLGEIHPAAVADGEEVLIVSARALRELGQYTAKRLAELRRQQAAKVEGSLAWRRLQRRKNRFLAQQKRCRRDIEHKVSRAVVNWAVERKVGTLVIGDVRAVANGKRLNTKSQQKISSWSHGRQRRYIEYKAEAAGIGVELVDEAYSSQTCPQCRGRHKPTGRIFRCPACGFVSHRDGVGSVNLLSRHLHGAVGQLVPPGSIKYRQPFGRVKEREIEWAFASCASRGEGKRSRLDTAEMASAVVVARHERKSEEAAAF